MADLSITAGSVGNSTSARFNRRKADVNITAGQALYKLANGKVGLFDANGVAPVNVLEGIANDTAAAGQECVYAQEDLGGMTIGATLAIGDRLYASATPGGITKTDADNVSGWFVTLLGVANSTTTFIFSPIAAGAAKA